MSYTPEIRTVESQLYKLRKGIYSQSRNRDSVQQIHRGIYLGSCGAIGGNREENSVATAWVHLVSKQCALEEGELRW